MRVSPAWTLGLLAGGYSRRMGEDKARLSLGGRDLLRHQASRLAPPGVPVCVGTRPDGPGRDGPFPWRSDLLPGAGPLSALAGLLQDLQTPFLLAVPCDLPLLPPDLGDRLLRHAGGADAVLMTLRGSLQPLPALVSGELRPLLDELLRAGERRAAAYDDRAPCSIVPFEELFPESDPEVAMLNVNDAGALERARRHLGAERAR